MSGSSLVLAAFVAAVILCAAAARFALGARARTGKLLPLVAGNLAILGLLLGVVLTGAELYYRFVFDQTDGFQITLTSNRWVERHYRFNNLDVRDDVDYERTIEPGRTRVTFLGDSFTAAYGVSDVGDRFVNLLRQRNPDWEVHTLARDGFDTGAHLGILQDYLRAGYQLDRVVYAYCLNDISDIIPEWNAIAGRLYAERHGFFVSHSYAINTWYWRLRGGEDTDLGAYYARLVEAYRGPLWQQHRSRLETLARVVEDGGGELSVVIFPFFEFLDSEEYAGIHAQLIEAFREVGVESLDLQPVYAEEPAERWIVNPWDTHPNEPAHAVAAERIEAALRR